MKRSFKIFCVFALTSSIIGGVYVFAANCGDTWQPDGADTYNANQ